jgi:hypothetical protein
MVLGMNSWQTTVGMVVSEIKKNVLFEVTGNLLAEWQLQNW